MDSTSITHKYLSFVYIAGKSIFHGILKIFLLNIFRFYFMKNRRIRTDVCINAWNMIKKRKGATITVGGLPSLAEGCVPPNT